MDRRTRLQSGRLVGNLIGMRSKITFPGDDKAINLGYQRSLDALLSANQETFSSEAILYVEGTTAPDVEAFLESVKIRPDLETAAQSGRSLRFFTFLQPRRISALCWNSLVATPHRRSVITWLSTGRTGSSSGPTMLTMDTFTSAQVLIPKMVGRLREVVVQSTPSGKQAKSETIFITSQLNIARWALREKYAYTAADRGGVLDVQIASGSHLRHRVKTVGLDASVTLGRHENLRPSTWRRADETLVLNPVGAATKRL